MKVQILGTGCRKCQQLVTATERAAAESGIQLEIEKVEDIDGILAFGVMTMPGLVINGEVVSSGKIPKDAQIIDWLETAAKG